MLPFVLIHYLYFLYFVNNFYRLLIVFESGKCYFILVVIPKSHEALQLLFLAFTFLNKAFICLINMSDIE